MHRGFGLRAPDPCEKWSRASSRGGSKCRPGVVRLVICTLFPRRWNRTRCDSLRWASCDPKEVGASLMGFVKLQLQRNRGWPWPDDSWGLSSMFGDNGWCHSCGVPRHPQTGPLTLRRKGLVPVRGCWVPSWRFDAICVERSVTVGVSDRFNVDLREVAWHGAAPGEALQFVAPSVGDAWFDPDQLRNKAIERHGESEARCPECGIWRWMPLAFGLLPPVIVSPEWAQHDVIASPEWFGAGL